jgi:chromosome segregation ATPase
VTQSKVTETVAGLNIQLDNMCQFLPQDRVAEFAKMLPPQLLLETEKALGSRELFEQHTALMAEKQGMRDLEADVAAASAQLERLRGQNASLERDVERFAAREKLLAKAEEMRGKVPWVKYHAVRQAWTEAKEKHAAAVARVRALARAQALAHALRGCSVAPARACTSRPCA